MPSRKDFLKASALGGAAIGLDPAGVLASEPTPTPLAKPVARRPAERAKNILILGGTGFIGPFQVRSALDRGHNVTLFNRGSGRSMFPYLETLVGDRNGDYESLRGRRWDVVIDNATNNPAWTEMAADFLKDSVDQFMYVSSRSAYADVSRVPMTIDAPSWTYESAGVPRDQERLPYGLGKAVSERIAQRIMPGRTTIVRPGLIIGPGDETDRFTYWPVRIHRGGEVLAPGDGTDPVQIIDVRDFTDFMALRLLDSIDAVERRSGREQQEGAVQADVVTRSVNVPDAAEDERAEDPPAEGEEESIAVLGDETPLSLAEAAEILGRTHLDATEMLGKLLALESRSRFGRRSSRGARRW